MRTRVWTWATCADGYGNSPARPVCLKSGTICGGCSRTTRRAATKEFLAYRQDAPGRRVRPREGGRPKRNYRDSLTHAEWAAGRHDVSLALNLVVAERPRKRGLSF